MRIVVLAGGLSPERAVSLVSGRMIAEALRERGHRVLLLDLYEGMEELPSDIDSLFDGEFHVKSEDLLKISDTPPLKAEGKRSWIGPHVLTLCGLADKVFLALHGSVGENGWLQATLDLHGIPYTGSDAVGSMLAMDKDLCKRLLRNAGLPTPDWMLLDPVHASPAAPGARIGFPCVIKPVSCGSSVGISMVERECEMPDALRAASGWGCPIMAEKRIVGRELTLGILDGKPLPAVEICPKEGFYDYQNKYNGSTEEICPAEISGVIKARIEAFSLRAFQALRLRGYARFDFILDHTEGLWCLEANTLPGMTPTSLFPRAAEAAGISYGELCERIVRL